MIQGGGKIRADVLLVERGLVASRAKAQALLLAGQVWSGTQRVDKAGQLLSCDAPLRLAQEERFVSRGGYKLEGALKALGCHWNHPGKFGGLMSNARHGSRPCN